MLTRTRSGKRDVEWGGTGREAKRSWKTVEREEEGTRGKGGDFRRGYADKSGQERDGEVKR